MKKATKNAKTTKPVGRGFQPRRKGNSRIAESGDVLAAKRYMLYLMPPSRSHGDDTRLFKIKYIGMVSGEALRNDHAYYKEPTHGWYWLWEAELISAPKMASDEPD